VADEAQVKLLKENGVEAWNEWRKRNPEIEPNIRNANFVGAELSGVDFSGADLRGADFSGGNLSQTNLSRALLFGATFGNSYSVDSVDQEPGTRAIRVAWNTDLSGANFRGTHLGWVDFADVKIDGADFSDCFMTGVTFGNINLSQCKGLETVRHEGPSTIGIDTIYLSGGNIPEVFLRGAGVPEPFIANMKALVAAMSPIEFYSCFISYSSKDQELAERLHADLRDKNVRCWFAPEDLKIGDRLRPAFDEAIRVHDKLMVLLSKSSVSSPWVEKEVETAFEKERREKRTVLFPIRLDDAVMETGEAWAADIRRTRHIGDFRDWKNHDSYKKAFERLLRDLKA
jgi:uncharacterized protein YjbI with pentapeptide repeats